MLQAPLRYKIEGKYLWTKFGSKEVWGKVYYVGATEMFLPVNQRFGANATPLYAQLGLKGHNGTDWLARDYTCVYAPCDALVTEVKDLDSVDPNSGTMGKVYLQFEHEGKSYRWVAVHLADALCDVGDKVKANQLIGLTGNTGYPLYTTGSHLHSGLYLLDKSGQVKYSNNGYGGAIDDFPFYEDEFAYKTDELKSLYDYARSNNLSYIGLGGGENFANACKKIGITGVTRPQYMNYIIKKLFYAQ